MQFETPGERIVAMASDGVEIVGRATGQGQGLLLVYGAMMEQTGWARLSPFLQPGRRVFTYDRRGRGESGDASEYAIEREVDDLLAFATGIPRPFDIFAHSSGALLVLHAAARGLPARRLVLYEPPLAAVRHPEVPVDLPARILSLVERGDPDAALQAFMREGMWLTPDDVARLRAGPRWQEQMRYAATAAYDVLLARSFVLRPEELRRVTQPVLLLLGEQSPDWMRQSVEAFAAVLADSRIQSIAGQGHNAQFTDPEQLGGLVRAFL